MRPTTPSPVTPAILAVLVENRRRFLAFLARRVGSRAEAEEVLQAALVRGLERAGQIRDEERVVAWFYRLLRRAVIDHWRAKGAERRGAEALARQRDERSEPQAEDLSELCRCFEPLLPSLKPEYEEILRRVDLGEMRPVDFAAQVGISPTNAMVRLHRARRALRARLLATCGACAEHGCLDCGCGRVQAGGTSRL